MRGPNRRPGGGVLREITVPGHGVRRDGTPSGGVRTRTALDGILPDCQRPVPASPKSERRDGGTWEVKDRLARVSITKSDGWARADPGVDFRESSRRFSASVGLS